MPVKVTTNVMFFFFLFLFSRGRVENTLRTNWKGSWYTTLNDLLAVGVRVPVKVPTDPWSIFQEEGLSNPDHSCMSVFQTKIQRVSSKIPEVA